MSQEERTYVDQSSDRSDEVASLKEALRQCNEWAMEVEQRYEQDRADFLRSRDALAYRASHDMRAPISTIKGLVGLLMLGSDGPLNDQQRRRLTRIEGSCDILSKELDFYSELSRVSTLSAATPTRCELSDLLRRVTKLAVTEDLVVAATSEGDTAVYVDVRLLEQSLSLLLRDLISRNGIVTSPFTAHFERMKEGVRTSLIFRGRHIDVFERFLRESEPYAIFRRVVRDHGGSIELEQIQNERGEIRFLLPSNGERE